jgi:hypothetical protein
LRIAGLPKRAISNQPGTEERSCGDVVERVGKSIAVVSMSDGEFGVSSIERVACKASLLTEIFSMRSAILAFATRPSQPRNSDAVANLKALTGLANALNPTDDFVAGNQGKF